jgi:hypothetical protein
MSIFFFLNSPFFLKNRMRISFKEKMNKKQVPQKDTCSLKKTFINTLLKREKARVIHMDYPCFFGWDMQDSNLRPAD